MEALLEQILGVLMSQAGAAWVQAIGSLAAVWVAVWIGWTQYRERVRDRFHRRQAFAAAVGYAGRSIPAVEDWMVGSPGKMIRPTLASARASLEAINADIIGEPDLTLDYYNIRAAVDALAASFEVLPADARFDQMNEPAKSAIQSLVDRANQALDRLDRKFPTPLD